MTVATPLSTNLRDRVAAALEANPRAMTIVLAREMGVPEADVVRAHPADVCVELAIGGDRTVALIREIEKLGRVHVIASNEGCTLETYGRFGGFSLTGPFFNVQTDSIDMHIRHAALASAFALIKPSHQDGQKTYSIQFYAKSGNSAFKVFLYKSVTEREGDDVAASIAAWEAIREGFKL
jgi:putative hemin transport protein